MKTVIKLVVLAMLAFLAAIPAKIQAQEKVNIIIKGIHSNEGHIRIAIFNSAALFRTSPCWTTSIAAEKTSVNTSLELPHGEYVIMLYHDVNNNEELDLGSYGIPKEPYAISGNPQGLTALPSFERCKFKVEAPTTQVLPLVLAFKK
jgi:uncharacterized protein (DUF2141 family)